MKPTWFARVIRWLPHLQLIILAIAGGVSAIISVLDLLGLIDTIPWFTPNIPKIALLLIAIIMLELVSQRDQVKRLERTAINIQAGNFVDLQHKINPTLNSIFGDYVRAMIVNASAAVVKQTVHVEGIANLRIYYTKTLEVFPTHTFFATSVASERYYWKRGTFEETIRSFISNGGTMERIFFVDNELDNLSAEEKHVIGVHIDLGVHVYAIPERFVPDDLKRLFVVEAAGLIGWESHISPTKEIRSSVATTDPDITSDLRENFAKIRRMGATRAMGPRELLPRR